MVKVLLVGCGNLGGHYASGLLKMATTLHLHLVDPRGDARLAIIEKFTKKTDNTKVISGGEDVSGVPFQPDLTIVATTANGRVNTLAELVKCGITSNIVIEKPLEITTTAIERLSQLSLDPNTVWVNTQRRAMDVYKTLRNDMDKLSIDGPLKLLVSQGTLHLLSNAIHFIDLAEFLFRDEVDSVKFGDDPLDFYPASRPGCIDAYGVLEAKTKRGHTLEVRSTKDNARREITVHHGNKLLAQISESEKWGCFLGDKFNFDFPGVSVLVNQYVDARKSGLNQSLPSLPQSIRQHQKLLSAIESRDEVLVLPQPLVFS